MRPPTDMSFNLVGPVRVVPVTQCTTARTLTDEICLGNESSTAARTTGVGKAMGKYGKILEIVILK